LGTQALSPVWWNGRHHLRRRGLEDPANPRESVRITPDGGKKLTQFTFGFLDKTVKNHVYSYFWTYDGRGHKSEVYLGRSGKPKTFKRALETKLKYLEGLQQQIEKMIKQTRTELDQLSAEEVKT